MLAAGCEVVAGIHDRNATPGPATATSSTTSGPGGSTTSAGGGPATTTTTTATSTTSTTAGATTATSTTGGGGGLPLCDNFVFVSSLTFAGNHVGPEADAGCQNEADTNGLLKPTWVAIYATSTTSAADHAQNVVGTIGVVCTVDQTVVAPKGKWWTGMHKALINVAADGTSGVNTQVWTGATQTGALATSNCKNWKSNDPNDIGAYGGTTYMNNGWADQDPFYKACDVPLPVYCLSGM